MREDISNRNTNSKNIPEIDSLYVYKSRHNFKFHHHHQLGVGYRYMSKRALLKAGEDEIHIYQRSAEINGVKMALTMVTKNSKPTVVKKWFNAQIKEIKGNEALFERFKQASTTPSELGIYFTY